MIRSLLVGACAAMAIAAPVAAAVAPFPASFQVREIKTDGATIHVRFGGHGPAVLLLHGFGDTGDMWQPLAVTLAKDHTVIAPDLRGMGLSSHPPSGYEKVKEAEDMWKVLAALKIDRFDLVTHDIGNMVGYALVAQHPAQVRRWVAMDAPLPGIGHWDDQLKNPKTWHFNFHGPDEERLVKGRERIFLDRFYNELSAKPGRHRRGHPQALRGALRPAAGHARRLRTVRRLPQGRDRQPGSAGQGRQADHAGAGHRRLGLLRRRAGGRARLCGEGREERDHRRLRPLADGGAAQGDHGGDHGFPRRALTAPVLIVAKTVSTIRPRASGRGAPWPIG
ncbi:MAG: alpha/beta fold hydrolase [Caulobacteraceae bacterium]